jgi:DNA mismatch repair protein MSH3
MIKRLYRKLNERVDAADELKTTSNEKKPALVGLLKSLPDIEKGICRIHYLSASPKEVIQVLDVLIKVSRAMTNGSSFESSLLNRLFDILPTIHDKVVQFRDVVNVDFKDKTDFFKAESKYPDIPQQKKNIVFVENEIIEYLKEVKTATQIHDLKYVSVSNIDVRR